MTTWEAWVSLLIAVLIPLGGAAIVQGLTSSPDEWYERLNKPSWTPPGYMFPVIWTILYVLMGVASWLVWRRGSFDHHPWALSLYIVQLVLNFAWTPIFFGLKRIDFAMAEIVLLWAAALATIVLFYRVNVIASVLLWPYLLWLTIAGFLTYYILTNNAVGRGFPGELDKPIMEK